MAQEIKHFMDEDDIGSGEKTMTQQQDTEQMSQLPNQKDLVQKLGHPQDGSQLHHVIEEQQYLMEQEGHIPRNAHLQEENTREQAAKEKATLSAPQNATNKPATSSSSAIS